MSKTLKIILIIFIILLVVSFIWWFFGHGIKFTAEKKIIINNIEIEVQLAQSAREKAKGLIGINKLKDNQGMLFIYNDSVSPTFHMKDMKFAIDIIWIKDEMVVAFDKNLPPWDDKNNDLYPSRNFINGVLEVKAGFVDQNQIKIGDTIILTDL